jgi:hypothetical protein
LWFAVTGNPTAEWLARQITEAFPWDSAPKYLIRDNDRAFGIAFKARVRAMGIRDRPTSFRSPWQNGYAERFGLTLHSGRMRPARARPSGSETLSPIQSSAGYTIDMHESDFLEATGGRGGAWVKPPEGQLSMHCRRDILVLSVSESDPDRTLGRQPVAK